MGRNRKPAVIRRAEGNPGKRPIPNEPVGHGRPRPPDYLNEEQKRCFAAIVKNSPPGVLCSADQPTLERAAVAWGTFRECVRSIGAVGILIKGHDNRPARHPLWIIMRGACEELERTGASLGLSPASRSRLAAPKAIDDDPLAILMRNWEEGNGAAEKH